jgi:hypothetical protein
MFAKLGLKFPVLWLCPFPCFAILRDVSTRSHENSEERANGLLLETASMTLSKRNAMCGQPHVQPKAREIEDCLKQKMGDAQSFLKEKATHFSKQARKIFISMKNTRVSSSNVFFVFSLNLMIRFPTLKTTMCTCLFICICAAYLLVCKEFPCSLQVGLRSFTNKHLRSG